MRTHAFKIFITGLLISGSAWASDVPAFCKTPVVSLKDSDQKILNPSLTGHLYQRAYLKLAQRLSLENLNTIEAYAATLSTRLQKQQIESFKSVFAKYGQASDYENFIQTLKKTDYWKPATRMSNSYVAVVAALARHLGEINLTDSEIESLWISNNWPRIDGTSLSKKLAAISGATEKKRHLTVTEFNSLLRGLGRDCTTITDAETQKKMRQDYWLTLRENQTADVNGSQIVVLGQVFVAIPSVKLPDQRLNPGSTQIVALKKYPGEKYETYIQKRHAINQKADLDVIRYFHTNYGDSAYVVVDKKQKQLLYFRQDGVELSRSALEIFAGDEINSGGAGIYFYASQASGFHFLQAERDNLTRAVFKSNASVPVGTPVYVLPATAEHHFRIRNHRLTFGANKVFRNRVAYNYTPLNRDFKKVAISVNLKDSFTKTYVKALQDEKSTLMSLLRIEDDDYNMLAQFAFGVLAPETDYGQNWKYKIKELAPVLVSLAKGNGFDTDANSRGPTQIKRIPEVIIEHYKMEKSDLQDPRSAAIATLAFSADLMKDLRNVAHYHPDITEETLQSYLYYLYQGRRWEIREATATPDKNASIRKIKSAISLLSIQDI
ncbi:hypothetical protein EZJ49_02530 [Bdellovibrio bacteriovorus]|uniref:hypothetical protein n=1 Tax=Bdellovibrio bacteriovorus TaxID=959 RepID=UPI0021CF38A9|nr:hypothetical protein [Bdellovibrio bacteriovorus]UXR65123.1 hypothetical protein EZJ49_02530 [Bdellovibrio bacteriovorus]